MRHCSVKIVRARTIRRLALFAPLLSGWVLTTAHAEPSWITSWNVHSLQFIDPPSFDLLEAANATAWQAKVRQGAMVRTVRTTTPHVDLAGVWGDLAVRKFELTLSWFDGSGAVVHEEKSWRTKAPDWGGFHEPPADWLAAADRNVTFLIAAADGPAPYREPGVPAWIWSAASPTSPPTREILGPGFKLDWYREAFQYRADRWPDGHDEGYPACMVPAMIAVMDSSVRLGRPQAERARELAVVCGDWALDHRLPDEGVLPRFPYSTISRGKTSGGIEQDSVNLLRASWLAIRLVHLTELTGDQRYLEYAREIAETTAKFQLGDGSFPYRINPRTGAVVEHFCTGAIQFTQLVEALAPHGVSPELALASERAAQWMIAYPAATNHWQGGYEDVGAKAPYENLTHWETQMLIQHLCRRHQRDATYLPLAKRLNRWVEDQFVLFGPDSESHPVPIQGPLVFEQFACWWPMEGHAGYWIQTLIALHKATGDQEYLDKARATANAICAQQFADGSICNWGTRWMENGVVRGENCGHNWYNTNAIAAAALYWLVDYERQLREDEQGPSLADFP